MKQIDPTAIPTNAETARPSAQTDADATPLPPAIPRASPRFIDLAIEPAAGATFKRILLIILGTAAFIAGMVAFSLLVSVVAGGIISGAGLIAVLIAAFVHAERKRKRQIDACIATHTDPAALFSALAEAFRRGDRKSGFQEAAKILAGRGHVGVAARLYVDALSRQVEPLTVEFEPCPLNEIDASFRGIALSPDEINESDERSETRRRFRRAWRMGGLWVNVYVLFQVIVQGYQSWVARWPTTRFQIFGAILVVMLVIQFTRISPSSHILLIPGGLIRRRPWWLRSGGKIHIFDPQTSVLIAHPHHGHQWAWTVADKDQQLNGLATEIEVRTLLRAWLSPVTPPTRQMLEGYIGV